MQRTHVRFLVVALVVASLVWIGYRVAGTIGRQRHGPVGTALGILPDAAQRLRDFHRVKLENGRMVWELRAQEAHVFEEDHRAVVRHPEMIFYTDGEQRARLRGDEGRVVLDGVELEAVELSGNVQVEGDGYQLETAKATYKRGNDVIVAPGDVRIAGKNLTVEGRDLEVAVSTRRLTLKRDVHVTLTKRDGQGP
jgi:LPS export ABC transporter protein LptC